MPQLNVTYLGGYLCREPEIRYVGESATALCQFAIAHTRNFQRNGTWEKETSFVDVKCWAAVAEKAATLNKGEEVIVSGRLTQERWTAADGSQRSKLTLVADKVVATGVPKASTSSTSRHTQDDDLPF